MMWIIITWSPAFRDINHPPFRWVNYSYEHGGNGSLNRYDRDTIKLNAFTFTRQILCTMYKFHTIAADYKGAFSWLILDKFSALYDIDKNGLPDVPFSGSRVGTDRMSVNYEPDSIYIAFQDAPGSFICKSYPVDGRTLYGISVSDLNGDGWLDISYADARGIGIYALMNTGTDGRTFNKITLRTFSSSFPNHVVSRDDWVVITDEDFRLFEYYYSTDTFIRIGRNNTCMEGLDVDDINRDGKPDIVCTAVNAGYLPMVSPSVVVYYYTDTGTGWIRRNSGIPVNSFIYRFRRFHGLELADMDGDGWKDIVACVPQTNWGTWGPGIMVWKNSGTYPFPSFNNLIMRGQVPYNYYRYTSDTVTYTCEVGIADFDCDGDNDVVMTISVDQLLDYFYEDTITPYAIIFENTGSSNMTPHVLLPSQINQYGVYGVGISDLNLDGKPDIVLGTGTWVEAGIPYTQLVAYYNNTPTSGTCGPLGDDNELRVEEGVKGEGVKVLSGKGYIEVSSPYEYEILSLDGRVVYSGKSPRVRVKRGVYFVVVKGKSYKAIVR